MKYWDISPRRKTKKATKEEKKFRKRSSVYFVFFLIVIAAFFIVFLGSGKFPLPRATATPTNAATSAQPSPANTAGQLTIKILNGTGMVEETEKVQTILTDNDFTVTKTENALNLYEETIVYYQADYETQANKINSLLTAYGAKLSKFTQSTQYSIVIVIGKKK